MRCLLKYQIGKRGGLLKGIRRGKKRKLGKKTSSGGGVTRYRFYEHVKEGLGKIMSRVITVYVGTVEHETL